MELDHLFICCAEGAPEAEQLLRLGLVEGAPNRHPGQGTANRRFFFRNAFLELLWVADPVECQSELVQPTKLWERWSQRSAGASPFGIAVRRSLGDVAGTLPFSVWDYRPPFLPAPLAIQMGKNSTNALEPLLFQLAFGRRPDSDVRARRQPLTHSLPLREIAQVRIESPLPDSRSSTLQAMLTSCPWFQYEPGPEQLMELTFAGGSQDRTADLRPALPLRMIW